MALFESSSYLFHTGHNTHFNLLTSGFWVKCDWESLLGLWSRVLFASGSARLSSAVITTWVDTLMSDSFPG